MVATMTRGNAEQLEDRPGGVPLLGRAARRATRAAMDEAATPPRASYERLRRERVRRGRPDHAPDALLDAVRAGRVDLTRFPGVGEMARAAMRRRDARQAARTLWAVTALLAVRATVVPFALNLTADSLPAGAQAQFAAWFDATAAHVSGILAVVTAVLALVAARRPLVAATLAVAAVVGGSLPFVLADPSLSLAHAGRAAILIVLVRAWLAGLSHRLR